MMKNVRKAVAAFVLAGMVAGAAFAVDARVVSVTGKVEVQKNGSWTAVSVGDVLSKGAVISTGFKSSADLSINNSTLTVGPLTRMTIEQLASDSTKDQAQLFIESGKVSANVQKSAGKKVDFKVSSPVATASVRGTEFTMFADGGLYTKSGLVSKGAPESTHARVVESDAPSSFTPADGESTATTPTSEVSAAPGIPVFAGQTSKTDTFTGIASNPQAEQRSASQSLANSTASLAAKEHAASLSSSSVLAIPEVAMPEALAAEEAPTGTVVLIITF